MEVYLIVIGKTATGYIAHCLDVDGCVAVGKTIERTIANLKEALEFHFEGMIEDGDALPHPGGVTTRAKAMQDSDLSHEILAHVEIDTFRFAALSPA